ncbi:hypothetical protein GQ55_7G168800 [Panicum hallii var. hallii]|uniref:Uncharacterized protein n=1 Tax=Panicum hallii var. hallii TaxID=1504633 RepID=A0A2T7CVY0_9POAL|nr:hypothetical protein GQ55_7G168800 [Panicum hallii var. hallii]
MRSWSVADLQPCLPGLQDRTIRRGRERERSAKHKYARTSKGAGDVANSHSPLPFGCGHVTARPGEAVATPTRPPIQIPGAGWPSHPGRRRGPFFVRHTVRPSCACVLLLSTKLKV